MGRVNWNGILRVLAVQHCRRDGEVIWEDGDLGNLLHTVGEKYILQSLFAGGTIPAFYYLGLDNRATLAVGDVLDGLIGEPNGSGYDRQAVASSTGFAVELASSGSYRADSDVVTFRSTGGSWGPVRNLFLTDKGDSSGSLIASVTLGTPFTVSNWETVSLRMGLTLRDCPVT